MRKLLGAILAVLTLAPAAAPAAEAVVVAATAPGYAPGQVIPDGTPIRLPEGAKALFLFGSGRTLSVNGPYEGTLDRLSAGGSVNRLNGFFEGNRFSNGELGAGRSLPPPGSKAAQAVRLAAEGRPEQAAAMLKPLADALAPLDLFLSSDRGLYPTYGDGERVRLVVQTNRDAHLYCTRRDERGHVMVVYPGTGGGTRVAGHTPVILSTERMPSLSFRGDQEVRCFATETDVSADLPAGGANRPLDSLEVDKLERTLDGIGPGRLVMAQVIVRVEPR